MSKSTGSSDSTSVGSDSDLYDILIKEAWDKVRPDQLDRLAIEVELGGILAASKTALNKRRRTHSSAREIRESPEDDFRNDAVNA
jgi:hypothetical protein